MRRGVWRSADMLTYNSKDEKANFIRDNHAGDNSIPITLLFSDPKS